MMAGHPKVVSSYSEVGADQRMDEQAADIRIQVDATHTWRED